MEDYSHFYALVQLIAGVNFAFILGDFMDKMMNSMLNAESLIEESICSFNKKWAIDKGTLDALKPIVKEDGSTNCKKVKELKERGASLYAQIYGMLSELKIYKQKIIGRKGFQALFLTVSFFSIFSLLLMALISTFHCWSIEVFSGIYCFLFICVLVYRVYRILSKKVLISSQENFKSIIEHLCIIFVAAIACFTNLKLPTLLYVSNSYSIFVKVMLIGLPFIAFITSGIYAITYYIIIKIKIRHISKQTEIDRDNIMRDSKVMLDFLNSFDKPEPSFGL